MTAPMGLLTLKYPHADLSAAKLKAAYDKHQQISSALGTEMIAQGRGYEKPNETRIKSDPLSQKVNAAADKHNALVTEMNRRERFHGSHKPLPQAHRQSFYGSPYG